MTAAFRFWLAVALLIVLAAVVWRSEPDLCTGSSVVSTASPIVTTPITCE